MGNILVKKNKTSKGFIYEWAHLGGSIGEAGELSLIEQDIKNISNEIKALNPVVNMQRKLREDLKNLNTLRDLVLKRMQNESEKDSQ